MLQALAGSVLVSASLVLGVTPGAHAQVKNNHIQNKTTKVVTAKATTAKPEVNVTVNQGDTLSAIAKDHQTTYQRLYDANTAVTDPDLIFPGQTVRIPDASEQLTHRDLPVKQAPVVPAAISTHATYTAPKPVATYVAPAPAVQTAPVSGCGDNSYANYIYMHESGCRTTASSANGCYGIGQACPASKIAYCGADYACQNAYFTSYANKYGGWAGAYSFWVSHGWW